MIEVHAFFAAYLLVVGHARLKKNPDGLLEVFMLFVGAINFAQMIGAMTS